MLPGVLIRKSAVYLFAAWACLLAAATFYAVVQAWHVGPYRDMWIAMDFIRAVSEGQASPGDFFALHGGAHRLLVPRLLYLADYHWLAGSNLLPVVAGAAAQLAVVVLVWHMASHSGLSAERRLLLVSLALLLMFNPLQLENFLYTFDVQWFLTAAAAAWALYFLVRYFAGEASSVAALVLAVVTAGISLFSSFSGMCLLLLLPLLAFIFRRSARVCFVSVALMVLVFWAYTRGSFGETTAWIGLPGPVTFGQVVHFVVVLALLLGKWCILYLGSPLGRETFVGAAIVVALSGSVLVYYSGRLLRQGVRGFSSFEIWCVSLALFAVLVAVATGWGRMHFVNTADEDRYQSIVALYWLGISGLLLARAHATSYRLASAALMLAWTVAVIPYAALQDMRAQLNQFDRVNSANLAIATGQWDFESIKSTLILGDKIKEINRPALHAEFLREKHWGIFATEAAQGLGQPFVPEESADACEGQLFSLSPLGAPWGGYRLSGQAYDPARARLLRELRISDEQGRLVGLGRLERQRDSLGPLGWQPRDAARWIGYTLPLQEETRLQVWGRRDDGRWCRAGSARLTRHRD